MTAQLSYHLDPYRRELDVEVLSVAEDQNGRFAVLSDTVLYPEGGGQPADRGELGGASIVDVQKAPASDAGAGIRHFFDGDLKPGLATLRLEWRRRFDHMQQHSAQHLLTAVAADQFGWPTTSFHLGPDVCDIEIDARSLSDAQLQDLEAAVAAEVRAARRIQSRWVQPAALADLDVRSRGLPAGHRGDVRLVEIEGVDLAACGGTHLRSTAEIGAVALLGVESMRGGLKLSWVAGERVRRRLRDHENRTAELRGLLGTGDSELASTVEVKLAQLKQRSRRERQLLGELARLTAAELDAGPNRVVERHFKDRDLGFLGQVARALCHPESDRVAFFTAKDDRSASLLLAAGGRCELDIQALGRGAAALLDGRGGGSKGLFQGKIESLDQRPAALEQVLQACADI